MIVKSWQLLLLSILVILSMAISFFPLPLPHFGAGVAGATTTTFYPITDGYAYRYNASGEVWNSVVTGGGTGGGATGNISFICWPESTASSTKFDYNTRTILVFNTSSIPVGATITAASLYVEWYGKGDLLACTPDVNVYTATPGNDSTISASDYQQTGGTSPTAFSTTIAYAAITANTWGTFALNASGIANINPGSNTRFSLRNANHDVANSLTWAASKSSYIQIYTTEWGSAYRPYLSVTYTCTPTITTLAATSIGTTSATLNGNVTKAGCCNVTSIGFVWDEYTVNHTAPAGNVSPSASGYPYYIEVSGYNLGTGGNFSYSIPAGTLTCSTGYYATAGTYSSCSGWSWGSPVFFATGGCTADWLSGTTVRSKVTTFDNGGGAVGNYTAQFDALYNGAIIESDSNNEFLYAPAARGNGTFNGISYDRTFIAGVNSAGAISIRQWDEGNLTLSDPITLWDFAALANDHTGCSVIVLQHQTGANSAANGSVLVATCDVVLSDGYSMRSKNTESIGTSTSDWGSSRTIITGDIFYYPALTETSDGTIRCFYYGHGGCIWYAVLTINASNPSADSWGVPVEVTDQQGNSGYCYHKEWVDGANVHIMFMSYYVGVWYIELRGNDTTWWTAGGTQKLTGGASYFTLGGDADHTPDLVQSGAHRGIWDIKTDSLHSPYIVYIAWDYSIERCYYSAGWHTVDTGVNTGPIIVSNAAIGNAGGAEMADNNVDIIYASVPNGSSRLQIQAWQNVGGVAGTWYIANGNNGTTAIAGDGQITQASPGDNFRPISVINGAKHFQILWFYTERYYGLDGGQWDSMRLAYPGFSNQNFLCTNKKTRSDFGDLQLTTFAGVLQPSASNGQPWIQEKTNLWRAIIWWKMGDVPTGGNLTNWIYCGNQTLTNANTQAIMDANFIIADHFDNGTTLDTAKWTVAQGAVTQDSSCLVLTSTASTVGIIDQNIANYPLFTYGEVRAKMYASAVNVGDYSGMGLRSTGSGNESENIFTMNVDYNSRLQRTEHLGAYADTQSGYGAWPLSYNIFRAVWGSASVKYYNDFSGTTPWTQTVRSVPILAATHTTHVSSSPQGLFAQEGNKATGTMSIDWIFARNTTIIEPKVQAGTYEAPDISNTPSSHDFGIVQPSMTYWAKGGLIAPGFPLQNGNCTGNVTNNSSFAIDVSYSMGNMTGGTPWTIGASPATNIFTMKICISGVANIGNCTILSATPQILISNQAAGSSTYYEFVFYTPTNNPFSDGMQKSGNITLAASAH